MRGFPIVALGAGLAWCTAAAAQDVAQAEALLKKSGCMKCHAVSAKKEGPSFKDVASRYKGKADAEERLLEKLRKGSSGAWGQLSMPPNPDLPETDARRLIQWVLGAV